MIKVPSCNQEKYWETVNRGFKRFPAREDNYRKYIKNEEMGFMGDVDYLPIKMDYEVSSRCNFRCKMCLMSENPEGRPPNMTFEDFKSSIDQQSGLIEVKLQGLGEPLLNRNFYKMAEYTVGKDIWTRTTTNASILHIDEQYKKLIDTGIGEIQISIDGATKETFEKIRVGSDFDQIVRNVGMLNDYAEKKNELWKTSCWVMLQKDNIHEIMDILELANNLKFRRLVYQLSPNDFGKEKWKIINGSKTVNKSVSDECKERLYARGKEYDIAVSFWDTDGIYKNKKICPWLFGRSYITSQMRITPCCMYWENEICDLGDARRFCDEWKSRKYEALREAIRNKNIPYICKRCYGMER